MKNGIDGKIVTEFVALRAKMFVYTKIDKKLEDKQCNSTKK